MSKKRKEIKYRNPYAKALRKKIFRQRVVKSGKEYKRIRVSKTEVTQITNEEEN